MLEFATLIIAQNIETVNGVWLFVIGVLEIHISITMKEVNILCRKRKPVGIGISSIAT